jgi:hypothetical protein
MVTGFVVLLAFLQAEPAQQPGRGTCNAKSAGIFRPEAANQDPELLGRLLRSGELEVCTFTGWRFHWRKTTVSVERLREERSGGADRVREEKAMN